MSTNLSPDTPIDKLPVSNELLSFAMKHAFKNVKAMLQVGFNILHKFDDFDYRLQREIIGLVQRNRWGNLIDLN
jgi:hypothetical protein